MKIFFVAVLICMAMTGCDTRHQPASGNDSSDPVKDGGDNESTYAREKSGGLTLVGYYIEDGENKYFKRSPGGDYYDLFNETETLSDRYREITFMLREPVYAVLLGRPSASKDELAKYGHMLLWPRPTGQDSLRKASPDDAMYGFTVNEVIEVDYVKRDNPIFPFEFRCYGEEPFWNLDIIFEQEGIFKDIGMEEVYYFPYQPPVIVGDTYTFEFVGADEYGNPDDEDMMIAVIEKLECYDSMSGEGFEYKVSIEYKGKTYSGCGGRL